MGLHKATCLGLAGAALSLWPTPGHGATRDWGMPQGAVMTQAAAWNPQGVPGKKDVARFNLASAYTVTFKSSLSNLELKIGNDKLVFDFGQGIYTLSPTRRYSVQIGLAQDDVGRVTFRNGTLKSGPGTIGRATGSSGNVTLSGAAKWNATGSVTVGGNGSGGLTIIGGSSLNSTTGGVGIYGKSKGNVLISGPESQWKTTGTLQVGGKTSTGSVSVRDGASLDVGDKLDVRKGSSVKIAGGSLSAGSIVRPGTVTFQAGELTLTRSDLTIGPGGALGSVVRIGGKQSLTIARDVILSGGHSELIMDEGHFSAGRTLNSGTIRIRGGEFTGTLLNGPGGRVDVTALSSVFPDDVVNNGELLVGAASQAWFEGNVSGSSGFSGGGLITFTGTYNPGAHELSQALQVVHFDNDIQFTPEARLRLDIGSSESFGDRGIACDRVDVNGQIRLSGVEISLADDAPLRVGDRFDLVTGSIVYEKDFHVNLPVLSSAMSFDVIRGGTALSVVVIPEPAAGTLLAGVAVAMALCRSRRR